MEETGSFSSELFKGSKSSSATSFVRKLYTLVSCESDDIVCFVPDGSAFEVKDPKKLESEVLPKYFRHSRFQSFVRQLNFYNFKKTNKERSMWIYKHELFHRDRPDFLDKLKRKTSSGEGRRLCRSQSMESNSSSGSPRNGSWAALVKSGSESFLQLSGDSQTTGMPDMPSHVGQHHPGRSREEAEMFRFPQMHISTSSMVPSPALSAAYSPKALSMSPSTHSAASLMSMHSGWHPNTPPSLHLQRNRSVDTMPSTYTDDEDDGDETDASSGSSWETNVSGSGTSSNSDEIPALGIFSELEITPELLDQLGDAMEQTCPSLSPTTTAVVLFCVRWATVAAQDIDELRNRILHFLFDRSDVNQELRAYRTALDPSISYDRVVTSPRSPTAQDPTARQILLLQGSFDKNRVLRDFISFSLMCIQGVRERWTSDSIDLGPKRVIDECHRIWRRVVSRAT